ncbi:MAG: DNRLRE domain-containing protein [Chloroflexi bacterium]|nr:DNRLRE domain-containing protein [Chloroflexota bacterium]MDA1174476.1 DNRLRE domain-containing protein [Chloroflexota bacterium]
MQDVMKSYVVLVAMAVLLTVPGCTGDPTPTTSAPATATPRSTPNAVATATPGPTATATRIPVPEPTATPTPVPGATSVVLTPDADATLYDRGTLQAANGAGESLFFGSTNGSEARRALIRFDVGTAIPAGSTIASARLVMTVDRARGEADESTLYLVTSSWGEGRAESETAGGGSGTTPDDGSATWEHRSFPDVAWEQSGGDYEPEPHAIIVVQPPPRTQTVEVTWGSTGEMVEDVQNWLTSPASNFGWIILGNEGTAQTAKRVPSRENDNSALRPQLIVEYIPATGPQSVDLMPSQDTTIYDDPTLANGAGEWLFVGATRRGALRRALVAFDVASAIPAGATVNGVTLTLTVSQTTAGDEPVALHRVLTHWSAGTADAEFNEGKGGPASADDATWLGTGIDGDQWVTPGGDITSVASASATVGGRDQSFQWTSAEAVADVQGWLDDPSTNHGWLLVGREDSTRTAKRFDSMENISGFPEPRPPILTIRYTP